MSASILVLGGCGNFGRRIAEMLRRRRDTRVRVMGHDSEAARAIAHRMAVDFVGGDVRDLESVRSAIEGCALVIDAAGPFQSRDYGVAELCIERGVHYLDLADARLFVQGIAQLDARARERGVMVASGASSVPAISSAMVERLRPEFSRISDVTIAITSGNRTPRGAATLASVLECVGRPFPIRLGGEEKTVFGWSDRRRMEFPAPVGRRWVHLADVPDVGLFTERYGAGTVRFYAGLELDVFHRLLQVIAFVRHRIVDVNLRGWGHFTRWISNLLGRLGTVNGALAVWMRGTDNEERPLQRRLAIVTDLDPIAVPCAPALILAEKLLSEETPRSGAFPCVGLLTFDEIATHLSAHGGWPVFGDAYEWHSPRVLERR